MDIAQFHKEQEKFKIQREKMYKEKIANLEFKQYTELVGILNKSNSELSQNIIYQKNKNASLLSQIFTMEKNLKEINIQYKALVNSDDPESQRQILEIKRGAIKTKIEDILERKFPEIKQYGVEDLPKNEQNEYYNMIYDHIIINFFQFDEYDNKIINKEKQGFRISKESSFSSLKTICENFWLIDNIEDYIFADEIEGVIPQDQDKVYDYLRNYSIRSNVILLIPIAVINIRELPLPEQENKMKELNRVKGNSNVNMNNDNNLNIEFNKKKEKIVQFNELYEGLKLFTSINQRKDLKEKEDIYSMGDNHLNTKQGTFSTSLIMLFTTICSIIFTILMIYQNDFIIHSNYQKIKYNNELFDTSSIQDYQSLFKYFVHNIGTYLLLNTQLNQQFIDDTITEVPIRNYLNNLYANDPSFNFFGTSSVNCQPIIDYTESIHKEKINFIPINYIHIKHITRKEKTCSNHSLSKELQNNQQCYSDDDNDSISINDKYISFGNKPENYLFKDWLNQLENGYMNIDPAVTNIIDIIKYFSFLIPLDNNYLKPKSSSSINDYETNQFYFFINEKVKSIQIFFTIYYPNDDIYLSCSITIKNTLLGNIIAMKPNIIIFHINYFTKMIFAFEITRLVLIILYIVNNVILLIQKSKETNILQILFSFDFLLNSILFIIIFSSFLIKIIFLNEKNEYDKYFNNSTMYIDTYSIALKYQFVSNFESIIFGLLVLRLIQFMKIFKSFQMLLSINSKSFSILIKYIIFLIIALISFSCSFNLYYPQIGTFSLSIFNVILMSLGISNYEELIHYNEVYLLVLLILVIMFIVMFTLSAFVGIYSETLRKIVIEHGYPYEDESKWGKEDYLRWLFPFKKTHRK